MDKKRIKKVGTGRPGRPAGGITRGKTAVNRLRRVDHFLCRYDPGLIMREDGVFGGSCFIDLGYGDSPKTTVETSCRLRRLNSRLRIIGVEISHERVRSALAYADQYVEFRLGGFNVPLRPGEDGTYERVRMIRAFNVLRQYDECLVRDAYALMAEPVLPGGLLIEGTSDPLGRIWSANLMRRRKEGGWKYEAVIFSTNFVQGFNPSDFRSVLPKNHIHRAVRGESAGDFLSAWEKSALSTRVHDIWGRRQWFEASARKLAGDGYRINLSRSWLRKGWLIWYQS